MSEAHSNRIEQRNGQIGHHGAQQLGFWSRPQPLSAFYAEWTLDSLQDRPLG
jgi:hypothetical protein